MQAGAVASVIPTYNVKPRQDRYGVAYTNESTSYTYTTDDGEKKIAWLQLLLQQIQMHTTQKLTVL